MARLYEFVRGLELPLTTPSAVAQALNESPQTVKNWEYRGISERGALHAEEKFGASALWLLGITPLGVNEPRAGYQVAGLKRNPTPLEHADDDQLLDIIRALAPEKKRALLMLLSQSLPINHPK